MNNKEEILKEIIPVKLTNDIDQNIKLIKRKLNIYNLKNLTNYSLEDLDIDIIYNSYKNITSIFYYYKELNEDFDYKLLSLYQRNFHEATKIINDTLKECIIYESKDYHSTIFLFKKDRYVLQQNLDTKIFWISNVLLWSKIGNNKYSSSYNWLEISNLCNNILEKIFKQEKYTTSHERLKRRRYDKMFKNVEFTTRHQEFQYELILEENFKKNKFSRI